MLKKTITYIDYDGNERTEDHYFNLSKAEVMEMELSEKGGMSAMLDNMIAEQNAPDIMRQFKNILLKSYGKKGPDGRRFIKSDDISIEFTQTEAYTTLLMELLSDENKMAEFIKGILPKDMNTNVPAKKE